MDLNYSNYAASIHLANFLRLILQVLSRFKGRFLSEPHIVNKSSLRDIDGVTNSQSSLSIYVALEYHTV